MTPSPPPYKCHHCRDQKFVGGYDGGPGSGQAEPCPRCSWVPPAALVEKALLAYRLDHRCSDCSVPADIWCCATHGVALTAASMSAALTASGMGALVALIERVGALQKSSANPELFPIIDDARTLLATLGTPEQEGR